MNKGLNKIIICFAVTFVALNVHAQKKNEQGIANQEVIVVKEYEATIQDAQKINIQPSIPDVPEAPAKLDYTIPTQEYKDIAFEPNPLKPLAVGKEKLTKNNSSFIKIGFGSQLMPLAQLAYNDNKTKDLKFGFFYDHLSAKGYQIKNQQFSDDLAGGYFKYFPKKTEIGADFTFHNYRTHFYGIEPDTSFTEKQVRQVFRDYDGNVYVKNAAPNKAGVDFKQNFNFNFLQETCGGATEWYAAGQTDVRKSFLQFHAVTFNFNFDVSELDRGAFNLERSLITPLLGYAFNNDDWKAHAKFGITADGNKVYFATDLHVEKRLYEHALIAYLMYKRSDQKNSLYSFAQVNPYVQDFVTLNNSVVGDFGAGLKGTAENFSYNVAFHLNQVNNMPLFMNDSLDIRRFLVVYDPNTLIYNVHFEAGYNALEWLRLLLVGDYNDYQLKTQAQAWYQPAFKTTFRATYVWKNKISVSLDVYGITSTQANLGDGQIVKLKGTGDINLGIEYLFNKHFSFFGTLNNIANFKYQPWYNYPGYGINGMVGAKFSF
jgi:hypothetical protein